MAEETVTLDGRSGKAPWTKMTKVFAARTAQEHAKHLLPYVKPDSCILDVGCGLGSITIGLADLAPEGQTIGIDSNPGTTQAAQEAARARGTPNVRFQIADAHDLSVFETGSFDVVHAHQVILHLPDPVKALKEIRRVLKDGGVMTTRDNILFTIWPEDPVLLKANDMFRQFTARAGTNINGGKCNQVWVHDAGFEWEKIRIEYGTWGSTNREERWTWAEGVKTSFRGLGLDGDIRTAEDFAEIQEHWEQWAANDEAKLYALDGVVLAWK